MENLNVSTNSNDALLTVYEEICKSYHALDDFRMKLLGLLPLTSLVGIFLLRSDNIFSSSNSVSKELISFIAIFAAVFTLALFIYEIRGILRCHDLINKGVSIERRLNVKGQFSVCKVEHISSNRGKPENFIFNSKSAACIIYSVVFAAWVFMASRYGMEQSIYGCALTAVILGLLIGIGTGYWVNRHIAA